MRRRNLLIIGSFATLGLVIALGGIFFWVHIVPHDTHWTLTSLQVNGQTYKLLLVNAIPSEQVWPFNVSTCPPI